MKNQRIFAIIQARMNSTRLPGKVLQEIAGQPMLARVAGRASRARSLDGVIVATTVDPADDPVAELCTQRGYPFTRGSVQDVLDRYYQTARLFQVDVIVRLTADCPLIDPGLIDQTVNAFLQPAEGNGAETSETGEASAGSYPYDFVANRLPPPYHRTYPIGLDIEICSFQALERAWKEANLPHQREHVMPYLYEQEGRFRVLVLNHEQDYGHLRWTVDTPQDLELVRQVYARFPGRDDFSWLEVLALFEREPELSRINAEVVHKTYKDFESKA